MPDLRRRIAEQFSYRGERADIWRVFDYIVETDAFLNLGYSPPGWPHVLGSSQRRLADAVGRTLATYRSPAGGTRVLDVGCGRGGPAIHLAETFGFRVTGIDLVPYNVARAKANAAGAASAGFVVGDATRLPVTPGSVTAAVAIDSLVYMPRRGAVLAALADALEPGGVLVVSDLLARPDPDDAAREAVAAFADAWDMPGLWTRHEYGAALRDAGFSVRAAADLTPHSVGRFRRWTSLFRRLHATPLGRPLDRLLERRGLNPEAVVEQIERAHEALPNLRHALLVAAVEE